MKKLWLLSIKYSLILSIISSCDEPVPPKAECALEIVQNEQASDQKEEEIKTCIVPEKEDDAQMQINITLNKFNLQQEEKMNNAIKRLLIVINSKKFKQRVLDHEYQGVKTFYDNNNLTNAEVYEHIMNASEVLIPGNDQEIDLDVTLYYTNNSTVGYTYPDVNKIWVNNKFFAGYTLAKVAANIVHEWTHKLGFGHDFKRTVRRNYSVPYGVGTIIRELIEEMNPTDEAAQKI